MGKNSLKKILDNPYLIAFCNKISSYNTILEHDISRNMFFVSLVSSDTLIDVHACDETIDVATFILHHIDLMILDDDIKEITKKHMISAIHIARHDKEEFINNKHKSINE